MDKPTLRRTMLRRLADLSSNEITERSQTIRRHLETQEFFTQARFVLAFVAMAGEVDTGPIINALASEGRLVLPRLDGNHLIPIRTDATDLTSNRYGILEPPDGPPTIPDLVLVPGLAFDATGRRLGRGRGFYDRFLPRRAEAVRCALAFELQLADEVPQEPHDAQLDYLVTEREVRHFRRGKD